eukprot:1290160-Lingulodinium_polyedra.AAC.1
MVPRRRHPCLGHRCPNARKGRGRGAAGTGSRTPPGRSAGRPPAAAPVARRQVPGMGHRGSGSPLRQGLPSQA